jgi:hypothetical protein
VTTSYRPLIDFFGEKFDKTSLKEPTKSYVVHLFSHPLPVDYSKSSLVLAYFEARRKMDFFALQSIADWILWFSGMNVHQHEKHSTVYETIAMTSYNQCYSITMNKAPIYAQLSNDVSNIIHETRNIFIDEKLLQNFDHGELFFTV